MSLPSFLPQAERSSAQALADRMVGKFEEYAQSLAPDHARWESITGLPSSRKMAMTPTVLFHAADKELYKSKQSAHRGQQESVPGPQPPVSRTEELAVARLQRASDARPAPPCRCHCFSAKSRRAGKKAHPDRPCP